MRIAIIGSGALGAFYGALLQKAGHELHFLVHSAAEREHLRRFGWRIDSVNGDFALPNVNAWSDPAELPVCDCVCVGLKSTQNHLLAELLSACCGPQSVAVCWQNGFGNERVLQAAVPRSLVLGGLCFLCSNKVGLGHIRHLDYGGMRLGVHLEGPGAGPAGAAALDRVCAAFAEAGIAVTRAEDLIQARWQKLVWNIPFNGLSVALGSDTQAIMRSEAAAGLAQRMMREVEIASAADGHGIPAGFVEKMMRDTQRMAPYAPSMKVDFDCKRPLELEYLYRRPVAAALEAGVGMPLTQGLADQLEFLDSRNRA